ncbi:MAG TPA: thioredoxin-dependent thiol peroxidase [candidate division Zixibacteria bacterium]|nr:thioredoxin-dependent thiol peroxidase [candidate division Zixibacteria bacterium]
MLNIKIGEKAPEFCLPNKDGNEVCIKELKGKWIVLYFYPKDNTKGCTIEAIDFTAKLDDFSKLNTLVLGISPDSIKSHQNFADKHELEVELLSDENHTILEKYGVWQEKSMYGKSYFGVVRSTILINPEGKIAEIWEKVRVADHVENVKNRLIELQK